MVAGDGVALVERVAGRHEQRDAAGPQLIDRLRDEVIVKRKAQPTKRRPISDGEVREGRIADREVEIVGEPRLVEVDAADDLVGIEGLRDARGDGVVLDADEHSVVGKAVGPKPHEYPAAASRLEDLAARKTETLGRRPHGAHDIFGRVMGILRGALERLQLGLAGLGDQRLTEIRPSSTEFTRAIGEGIVGQLRRSEADKLRDALLFLAVRRPGLAVELIE